MFDSTVLRKATKTTFKRKLWLIMMADKDITPHVKNIFYKITESYTFSLVGCMIWGYWNWNLMELSLEYPNTFWNHSYLVKNSGTVFTPCELECVILYHMRWKYNRSCIIFWTLLMLVALPSSPEDLKFTMLSCSWNLLKILIRVVPIHIIKFACFINFVVVQYLTLSHLNKMT